MHDLSRVQDFGPVGDVRGGVRGRAGAFGVSADAGEVPAAVDGAREPLAAW